MALCGAVAGAINGLFGAGGGMILIPALTAWTDTKDDQVFPNSVSIILPICIVSLSVTAAKTGIPFREALPYLLGGIPGGIIACLTDQKIPTKWLHRIFGGLIIWGGIRYLC